jgi:protein-tyrosine phosphatase
MPLLQNILNFRDVGKTINDRTHSNQLQTGKFFRSARLDEANRDDRLRLVKDFGIKTIIDLRTKTEHMQQVQKDNASGSSSEVVPKTHDEVAPPLKFDDIEHYEINFNGWAFSRSLISELSWWNTFLLVGLMAMGYRIEAISVLGSNVMKQEGLVGLAIRSVDTCTQEVYEVFKILSEAESYPILVHCTQGKDRTGLVVQLVLMLLEVAIEAINHDYVLSQEELQSEREERLKEICSIGLTEEFADCDPRLVEEVARHINQKYGSIEKYLEVCGVTEGMQVVVKELLTTQKLLDN